MKIGILSGKTISETNRKVLNTVIEDKYFQIPLALIDSRSRLSMRKRIIKNIRKGRGGYILVMFFDRFIKKRENMYSATDFYRDSGIKIIETSTPYSAETLLQLKDSGLDILILINGYGIIKEQLLTVAPLGVLAYHHGNMRKYRGMPPAFWELYNNENEIGITVQKLRTGLDCGLPVVEKTVQIKKYDTLSTLKKRIYEEGIDMMHFALVKMLDHDFTPVKIESYGKVYTLPNLRQWFILQLKLLLRKFSR